MKVVKSKSQDPERDLGLRIGVAVRGYRELAGLTQTELAKRVKVAQAEISLIERGKRSKLSTLDRVSEALGQRLSDLIRFAEDVGDTETVVKEARAFVRRVRTQRKAERSGTPSKQPTRVAATR